MNRRTVLGMLSVVGTGVTAGCSRLEAPYGDGVNETVEIINEFDREVTLNLLIEERQDDGEYDPVMNTDITVGAISSTERDLLGQSQYRITVSGLNQEVELINRPICDGARTRIIITESEWIDYWVADCEGVVQTRDDEERVFPQHDFYARS